MNPPRIRIVPLLLACFISGTGFAGAGESLSLDAYLSQVRKQHQGFVSSVSSRDAAQERSQESSLLLSPTLIGNATLASDAKPTANPTFSGEKTFYNSYSLGIAQNTSFGLSAKLGYSLSYTNIQGAASTAIPVPTFHDGKPSLELSLPLWRNWGGSETRASMAALGASALAVSYTDDFKASVTLAEAENAYWRLALARETVEIARDTLDRARKIRDWSARRASLNLADRADVLVAEAALQFRELELQNAINEERAAARAFNTGRNIDSEEVREKLPEVDPDSVAKQGAPERAQLRSDIRAAQELSRANVASNQLAIERNKPQVELFASLSLNGRDLDSTPALSESLTLTHPTNAVGLKFTAPLDLSTTSRVRSAYAREQIAAEKALDRKIYEQEREWVDLGTRLEDARKRLELARRLENAQKAKLLAEKDRHERGRSTTFQVLQFEQDFAESRLNRIRTEAEILGLVVKMKTFSSSQNRSTERGES